MSQTQDEINYGQQIVNYELVQIDLKLLEAIKALVDILTASAVPLSPAAASGLRQIDFSSLDEAISRAHSISKKVADISPPGCAPEQNSESFLSVARSLNIDGPSDWSSRLDDYLYGGNERIE